MYQNSLLMDQFSMCIPPIQEKMKENDLDAAIIVGIEVSSYQVMHELMR